MIISPFNGNMCNHCLLGGTSIGSWLASINSNGSVISLRLHVPSMYFPPLNIVTGPTPTVKTLGKVVTSSL